MINSVPASIGNPKKRIIKVLAEENLTDNQTGLKKDSVKDQQLLGYSLLAFSFRNLLIIIYEMPKRIHKKRKREEKEKIPF